MAFKFSEDGKIVVNSNPIIIREASGIVSLANSKLQVNEKDLIQEISKRLNDQYSIETDCSGNFAGRVQIMLEILCDHTVKGGDET